MFTAHLLLSVFSANHCFGYSIYPAAFKYRIIHLDKFHFDDLTVVVILIYSLHRSYACPDCFKTLCLSLVSLVWSCWKYCLILYVPIYSHIFMFIIFYRVERLEICIWLNHSGVMCSCACRHRYNCLRSARWLLYWLYKYISPTPVFYWILVRPEWVYGDA